MDKAIIIDKIGETISALNEAKRQYYSEHFYEFNRDILKWPDLYEPLHRPVCDFVQKYAPDRKLLMLLPRGTFKSSVITVGYSLWRIVKNPMERILIANATYPMATSFLSQIKNHLQRNQTLIDIFGNLATSTDSWREDRIAIAREKSYEQKEPTVWAQGTQTNAVGSHFSLAILDDLVARENIGTKDQIEKIKNYYRDVLDLVDPNPQGGKQVIICGCFVRGTKVLMADGTWKNIEDINVGEIVKTRNGNRSVTANIPQGVSDVYELRTNNGKIIGTKNHPFMTNNKWIKMENLQKGDKIAFYRFKKDGKEEISNELAWALGYMVGDGWVTLHPNNKGSMRYVVGIARGIYDDRNDKVRDIFERNFDCKFKIYRENWQINSARLGRWLLENGLERGAKNKKVPNFMFRQNSVIRIAFIKGFLDADGWKVKYNRKNVWQKTIGTTSFAYEVSSKELAYGIRNLAIISGIRVNNISSRKRLIKAPHSKNEVISNTHHCSLYFDKKELKEIDGTFVRSIKKLGKQEVYDLSVEGEHSFIAEGFIVHNTTWHWDDLYAWILNPKNNLRDDFAIMKLPVYEGEWGKGKLLFPKRLDWKQLSELKRQQGITHFSAQYLLNPVPEENATFKGPFRTYEETDLRGLTLNKFITIDPAISEEKEADYSAMTCIGVDANNDWYVLDIWREKVQPKRLIEQIFYWDEKWKPTSIGIETVAYQKALQYFIQDEMKRRNVFIPLKELGNTDKSKDERIRGLQPRYETGSVFHNQSIPNTDFLEDELLRFPKNDHDDIIDSLASQLELAFPPRTKEKREHQVERSHYPA